MNTARRQTAVSVEFLNGAIAEAVTLQAEAAALKLRLKNSLALIKSTMIDAGLERHATPAGAEALIYVCEALKWNVDKLADLLSEEQLDGMCPRKPNAKELRKVLDHNVVWSGAPDLKKLRACAKATKSKNLTVRAAGQVEAVADQAEAEEEAA